MAEMQSAIWHEDPEQDNPYAARVARCFGFDVFGEMLGRVAWSEMVYLLFTGAVPTREQSALLNDLAVAVSNPGPRDPSVHAAMAAGVGGSTAAATLMAALAVGAGQGGGGRDVLEAMCAHERCGRDLSAWAAFFAAPADGPDDVWPDIEHAPGFDPHGCSTPLTVMQALAVLARHSPDGTLGWLQDHRDDLQGLTERPLSIAGVAAATLIDLGFSPAQGEMLYLLLRLPGAAAHAMEQAHLGFKSFPFGAIDLLDDPRERASRSQPPVNGKLST